MAKTLPIQQSKRQREEDTDEKVLKRIELAREDEIKEEQSISRKTRRFPTEISLSKLVVSKKFHDLIAKVYSDRLTINKELLNYTPEDYTGYFRSAQEMIKTASKLTVSSKRNFMFLQASVNILIAAIPIKKYKLDSLSLYQQIQCCLETQFKYLCINSANNIDKIMSALKFVILGLVYKHFFIFSQAQNPNNHQKLKHFIILSRKAWNRVMIEDKDVSQFFDHIKTKMGFILNKDSHMVEVIAFIYNSLAELEPIVYQ